MVEDRFRHLSIAVFSLLLFQTPPLWSKRRS
ncbi:hypothetical protein GCK32_015765 [Trichostrongylus colubriformis]|uniref:Uncharacterized protein n=1 Tax=Trichostrongylus colubriformis TaxID=6319 RepID=A0AAN8FLX0_TRICO